VVGDFNLWDKMWGGEEAEEAVRGGGGGGGLRASCRLLKEIVERHDLRLLLPQGTVTRPGGQQRNQFRASTIDLV